MRPNNKNRSDFYCTKCGNKGIPIIRKKAEGRSAGHLKRLWCIHCEEEVNHVECKPFTRYTHEDFLVEMENHNFDKDGNRVMSYGALKQKLNDQMLKERKERHE